MKKMLHILPHCSTGGSCAFALKRIESCRDNFDITCVEYQNLSNDYIIHRKKIQALLSPFQYIILGENKKELLNIINNNSFDLIFWEEIPELFCDFKIAECIYSSPKRPIIIETSHSSDFNPANKLFLPDKFLFVSPFSAIQYAYLGVPTEIIEYPIETIKTNKSYYQDKLKFDTNKKHVLVLGLWTPRKSQGTVVDIARLLINDPIHFHFVGNAAPNFAHYHSRYLNNLPPNCTFWGEQDSHPFLSACDLQIFASKGHVGDMELLPLCIKESLSYNLPLFIYNLDVYLEKFKNNPNINFLTGDLVQDSRQIKDFFRFSSNTNDLVPQTIFDHFVTANFNKETNKITIRSQYTNPINLTACVVKEIDSEIPIYFWENIVLWPGGEIWTIPIGNYNFDKDEFCNGFLLEFYYNDKILFTKTVRIKSNSYKYKIPNLNPFDCLYINYREFFHTKIYDDLIDFNNLNLVIDVGANVGLFSSYILSKKDTKIYALEPDPKAFRSLQGVFNQNENVKLFNLALHNANGSIRFETNNQNTTISKINSNGNIVVQTITWDTFIQNYVRGPISLLKLDIEENEYDVFKTISNKHLEQIDQILLEFHNNNGRLINIIEQLKIAGFEITLRKQSSKEPAIPSELNGLLFAKKPKNI